MITVVPHELSIFDVITPLVEVLFCFLKVFNFVNQSALVSPSYWTTEVAPGYYLASKSKKLKGVYKHERLR